MLFCANSATNASVFINNTHAVAQLCDLLDRCEDPAIVFEGTRVFVNVARAGAAAKLDERIIRHLVKMLVNGTEYPVLLGEAIIALALVAQFGSRETVRAELQGHMDLLTMDMAAEVRANADTLIDILNR